MFATSSMSQRSPPQLFTSQCQLSFAHFATDRLRLRVRSADVTQCGMVTRLPGLWNVCFASSR